MAVRYKAMKKKITLILALALILCLLCACGSKEPEVPEVDMDTVSIAVGSAFSNPDLTDIPDSYIETMLKLTSDQYAERFAKISSVGTNIDEYGIFRANDAAGVKTLEKALNDYLAYRMEIWMDEYLPEELPKLQNATVTTCGNYVMYVIADSATYDAAQQQFKSCFAG